jgi:hypothetical protein
MRRPFVSGLMLFVFLSLITYVFSPSCESAAAVFASSPQITAPAASPSRPLDLKAIPR